MDYSNHMPGFTKLFSGLVHSTVWREEMHVKVVWITMLALADRNGHVLASLPGLADASRVTLEQCQDALAKLAAPDVHSRTKLNEGRRIEEVDGGWRLLNYLKYRNMRDEENRRQQVREAVGRYRAKQSDVIDVSHGKPKQKQKQKQTTDNGTQAAPAPWSREAADDFKAVYGGNPPAQFFPHVAAVVKKHAWETVRPILRAVLEETPLEFLNLPKVLGVKVEAAAAGILAKPPRKGGKTIESPVDSYDAVYEAIKRGEL